MGRKKSKKKATTRRRRVGAAGGGIMAGLTNVLAAAAGAAIGRVASGALGNMDKKLKGGLGVVAAGVGVAKLKSPMAKSLALGFGSGMALDLLSGFGLTLGSRSSMRLNGNGVSAYVNGPGINAVVNGVRGDMGKRGSVNGNNGGSDISDRVNEYAMMQAII